MLLQQTQLNAIQLINLFLLFSPNIKAQTSEEVSIELFPRKVKVLGLTKRNWLNETYYAFRGISYAKPPLGELRFKSPDPLIDLPDEIDARYDGHDCPSISATNVSEDCLNLNVYTSHLQPPSLLPVLVFIHPGGLYLGSGLSSFLEPTYMLSKPLVMVTFNYRLGTLGFIQLESLNITGNAGFKDQVLALEWVKQHIASFGGNPLDVTLMGYSAGGLSVTQHLVSPLSKDLFHKAIAMSGSLPPQVVYGPNFNQHNLALRQAKLLNCTVDEHSSDVELLACFQQFNGTEIAATLRGMFEFGKDNPIYLWLPQVEKADANNRPFLSEPYYEALKTGRFHKVPILMGFTDGEFCTSVAELIANPKLEQDFYDNFGNLAPKIFMYEGQANALNITKALRQHYLINSSPGHTNFKSICDLFSDAIIRFGMKRTAQLLAQHMPPDYIYSYEFAYVGNGRRRNTQFSSNLRYADNWGKARVEHMDDLSYLFRLTSQPQIQPNASTKDDDAAMIVQLYVNFIYDFIRNARLSIAYPNGHALITDKIQFINGTNFAEYAFWDQLIP